jgi:hypothetical protein
MIHRGEPVDLSVLEDMALTVANVCADLPEAFFQDDTLAGRLVEPIYDCAVDAFGPWVCGVTTDRAVGVNIEGLEDEIIGYDEASFFGRFRSVRLKPLEVDPLLAGGLEFVTAPVLVFEIPDDPRFDKGLAQTYLWSGLPLVGAVATAEKYFTITS